MMAKPLILPACLLLLALSPAARGETTEAVNGAGEPDSETAKMIEDYCLNIADTAADARAALQAEQLKSLEAELESRIKALDAKRIEVQGWVEKQEALVKSARSGLVEIYAKMDPEAAARQLTEISQATAASIVSQLNPRNASAILNEMEPEEAAALVKILALPLREKKAGSGS